MWGGVDRLGGILLDATLATTALLGVVALGLVACRQPVRRRGLARAGLLGTLGLLPLVMFRPLPQVSVREVWSAVAPPGLAGGPGPRTVPTTGAGASRPDPRGATLRRGLTRGLVVLYLAGVATSLGGLALGWGGSRWLARRATEPSSRALDVYDGLPWDDRKRRPRLRISHRVRRPVLLGMGRPTILVPPTLDQPEAAESLRLSLLHELAHADQGDPWFGGIGGLAQAFWFFHPLFWWVRRQMRLDQEFLADRFAASDFGASGHYAASLVALAGPGPRLPARAAGLSPQKTSDPGTGSFLYQRVLMLLQCPFRVEDDPPLWWSGLLAIAIPILALVASTLTLGGSGPAGGSMSGSDPRPTTRSFRMSSLVVAPKSPEDRARAFDLPVPLPPRFTLVFEVWADSTSLAEVSVVGLSLGGGGPILAPGPAGWHRVEIRREPGGTTLRIDGRSVGSRDPRSMTRHLSILASSSHEVRLRNLRLSW